MSADRKNRDKLTWIHKIHPKRLNYVVSAEIILKKTEGDILDMEFYQVFDIY